MQPNLDEKLLALILAPITGDEPLGRKPAENDPASPLVTVDNLHNEAIDGERQADRCRDSGEAEKQQAASGWLETSQKKWQALVPLAVDLLTRECKDVGVLAKLIQALARTDGPAGLAFGYRIAAGLVERYWDHWLARWKGDVGELTLLANLDSTLGKFLRRLAVTSAGTPYYWAQRLFGLQQQLKKHAGESGAERNLRLESQHLTATELDAFGAAVVNTPAEFYQQLVSDIGSATAALDEFQQVIQQKFHEGKVGDEMPSPANIAGVLGDVLLLTRELAGDKLKPVGPAESVGPSGDQGPESAVAARQSLGAQGEPIDRKDAFRQLEVIAKFFEGTEPHSLLPAQLRRVIRQGHLAPQALFEEVIEDVGARERMFKLVGIVPTKS